MCGKSRSDKNEHSAVIYQIICLCRERAEGMRRKTKLKTPLECRRTRKSAWTVIGNVRHTNVFVLVILNAKGLKSMREGLNLLVFDRGSLWKTKKISYRLVRHKNWKILPWSIDGNFNCLVVGCDLRWTRRNRYRQRETLAYTRKREEKNLK